MKDWRERYVCAKDQTPEPFKEVWLRVNACRPRKAEFVVDTFFYKNKILKHTWCGVSENVYWRYVK